MAEMKTKSGITVNVIGQAQIGGRHLLIIELPNAQYYHSGDNIQLFKHLVLPLSEFEVQLSK